MVMAAGDAVGKYAAASPLAWSKLDDKVLLIMERPEFCMDLLEYINIQIDEGLAKLITLALALRWTTAHLCRARPANIFGCSLTLLSVHQEFMRQLVAATIQMHMAGVFPRDLNLDNNLIEYHEARPVPRVPIIDCACGCLVTPGYRSYVSMAKLMLTSKSHFNLKLFSFLTGTSCYKPPEFYPHGTYEAGPTTIWQLGSILLPLLTERTDSITIRLHLCEYFLTQNTKELKESQGKAMLLLLFFMNILQLSELVINGGSFRAKGPFPLRLPSSDCKKFLNSCFLSNPDQRITLKQTWCHLWIRPSLLPEA